MSILYMVNTCICSTFQSGLINGGLASLLYRLILSFLGSLANCASLAEMALMYAVLSDIKDSMLMLLQGSYICWPIPLSSCTHSGQVCNFIQLGGWYEFPASFLQVKAYANLG